MYDFRLGILLSGIGIGLSGFRIGILGTVDFVLHYCMGVFLFLSANFPLWVIWEKDPSINRDIL
jgi:hypothetical protein